MIIESLIDLVANFVGWIIEGVPAPDLSVLDEGITGFVDLFLSVVGPFTHFFPLTLMGVILGAYIAIWASGVGLKLVRIVASFFTAGGGSAA